MHPLQWLLRYLRNLRFPVLLVLTAAAFLVNLFVPDPLPFADEILLGLVTALLGSLRRRRHEPEAAPREQGSGPPDRR